MIDLSLRAVQEFVLVLLRTGACVAMFPVFGGDTVPFQVKAALSLVLAAVLFPVVRGFLAPQLLPASVMGLGVAAAGELMVGFALGFAVQMLMAGAELAGHMIGYQMGFGIVSVIDPQSQQESSLMAELMNLLTLLVFLCVNGHHIFLRAMAASFEIVPPGALALKGALCQLMMKQGGQIFLLAIKMGAPVIAALLFVTLGFALLSRAVPQLNVLVLSFPVSIVVGLIFFGLSLELSMPLMERQIEGLSVGMTQILRAM
jgi:flagellar biosynthetic protein FliR